MAQPPVIYKPGKLNYVWNWLGKTLSDFTKALMPYIIKTGFVLKGKNYVFVSANGTPEQNGNELKAAYDTAKTMNPTADSRISVIAAPGNYFLSSDFELDAEYIDLVSLDGNRSIIIDGPNESSSIYYFSDQGSGGSDNKGYNIDSGGDDMYDGGNEIYVNSTQIAYTHTQIGTEFSLPSGMPLGITAINTFTYTASGTGLSDSLYQFLVGTTTGNGNSANFDVNVAGGIVTSVIISNQGGKAGIDYAVNDTLTILGSQIGGVDGIDNVVITVTSLKGYFPLNTSVISTDDVIDTITYVATGSSATDGNFERQGTTTGSGRYGMFDIEVVGGIVTSVTVIGTGTAYNVNDTITILGSQIGGTDGVDDVIITVTGVFNNFGATSSYFTNMYPGFFFMGARGTDIDNFKIDGELGADGNGFLNYYTYSQGGYQVYVKRVGGANDTSVNHIIIVNPSNASLITQTVGPTTNDDTHDLTGLLSAGVTEIYYILSAKSEGVTLSNTEVTNIVSEFLTIRNSSTTINNLLTNLNANYLNLTQQIVPVLAGSTINVTGNDVFIKGVDVLTKQFLIGNNLSLLKVDNCAGGILSFGFNNQIVSGTFTDCVAGNLSFASVNDSTASGIFTNCVGGPGSFGRDATGTFTNCIGGGQSFGSNNGTASGTFIDCIGGNSSFGGNGDATGTFNNCVAGEQSFGSNGTASGTFNSCVAGQQSFGYNAPTQGTFTNCTGGADSFGGNSGTLTGKLYYCRLTSGSFQTLTGAGLMRACVDGNDVFIPSLDA